MVELFHCTYPGLRVINSVSAFELYITDDD